MHKLRTIGTCLILFSLLLTGCGQTSASTNSEALQSIKVGEVTHSVL